MSTAGSKVQAKNDLLANKFKRTDAAASLAYLQSLDYGLFLLVNSNRSIGWSNAKARNILDEGSWINAVNGTLQASDNREQWTLENVINNPGSVAVLNGTSGLRKAMVKSSRFSYSAQQDACALSLVPLAGRTLPALADISLVFGLTPAEMGVLDKLAGGERVEDLMLTLNIARNTAQTHIKRIYRKTGANSRESLLALLRRYSL